MDRRRLARQQDSRYRRSRQHDQIMEHSDWRELQYLGATDRNQACGIQRGWQATTGSHRETNGVPGHNSGI